MSGIPGEFHQLFCITVLDEQTVDVSHRRPSPHGDVLWSRRLFTTLRAKQVGWQLEWPRTMWKIGRCRAEGIWWVVWVGWQLMRASRTGLELWKTQAAHPWTMLSLLLLSIAVELDCHPHQSADYCLHCVLVNEQMKSVCITVGMYVIWHVVLRWYGDVHVMTSLKSSYTLTIEVKLCYPVKFKVDKNPPKLHHNPQSNNH